MSERRRETNEMFRKELDKSQTDLELEITENFMNGSFTWFCILVGIICLLGIRYF